MYKVVHGQINSSSFADETVFWMNIAHGHSKLNRISIDDDDEYSLFFHKFYNRQEVKQNKNIG